MQNYQTRFFFTDKEDGNLAFHVGEDKIKVIQRHKQLAHKHHYNYKNLIHMRQIHSDIVHILRDEDTFTHPPECDALVTNKTNIPMMVMVADCAPILLRDERAGVVAVVHAGRQGAFKNILTKTIHTMHTIFHSQIKDIHVTIGTSICQECYEIGPEIYEEIKKLGLEYSILIKNKAYYLDVTTILRKQLKDAKIKDTNITLSKECSSCHNEKYYSYRKEGQTGRFSGVIELIER